MPGPGYDTDDDVMLIAATNAMDIAGQLRATAGRMSAQLEAELNQATWVGAASNAFTGVHERMRIDMDKIDQALDRLARLVSESARGYRMTDDEGEGVVTRAGAAAGSTGSALNW